MMARVAFRIYKTDLFTLWCQGYLMGFVLGCFLVR